MKRCITAAISLYGTGFLAWQLLRWFRVDHQALDLLDVFLVWLYLPVLPLIVLGLAWSRRALVWLLPPLALFAIDYGPLYVDQSPPARGESVRMMTANLLATNNDQAVVAAVLEAAPDILAVQELNPRQAARLSEALRDSHPYRQLHPHEGFEGIGLYSRFPIREVRWEHLGGSLGSFQDLVVTMNGSDVTLINAHPWAPALHRQHRRWMFPPIQYDTTSRDARLDVLLQRIDGAGSPVIALGDFNLADRESAYQRLTRSLADAHRDSGRGFGFTFPAHDQTAGLVLPPLIRIDYVFHDRSWRSAAAWTKAVSGSDHLAVIADLIRTEAPRSAQAGKL